jgi:hypothetical protein
MACPGHHRIGRFEMPRPQKGERDRRDEILRVRLTTVEMAMLAQQADAAGMTLSDYCRSRLMTDDGHSLNQVGRQRRLVPEMGEAVRTLSALGLDLLALRQQADDGGQVVLAQEAQEAVGTIVAILKRLRE